jgi:Holliday junction resolvasome RuvABC endonuclease subunit
MEGMRIMRYLALDIATTTGWVVMDTKPANILHDASPNEIVNFGKIVTTGSTKNKIASLYKQTAELAHLYQPDFLMFEDIFYYKNVRGFKMLSYLQGAAILAVMHQKDIPIIALSSRSVRKVLGIVNNERKQIKQDVINYVNKELGTELNVKEHNDISDAILLVLSYLKNPNQYTLNFGE